MATLSQSLDRSAHDLGHDEVYQASTFVGRYTITISIISDSSWATTRQMKLCHLTNILHESRADFGGSRWVWTVFIIWLLSRAMCVYDSALEMPWAPSHMTFCFGQSKFPGCRSICSYSIEFQTAMRLKKNKSILHEKQGICKSKYGARKTTSRNEWTVTRGLMLLSWHAARSLIFLHKCYP